jgi:hypothetical protein
MTIVFDVTGWPLKVDSYRSALKPVVTIDFSSSLFPKAERRELDESDQTGP